MESIRKQLPGGYEVSFGIERNSNESATIENIALYRLGYDSKFDTGKRLAHKLNKQRIKLPVRTPNILFNPALLSTKHWTNSVSVELL